MDQPLRAISAFQGRRAFELVKSMIISLDNLLMFTGAALLLVLTPGPNMIYLISRTVCQGRRAGVISLFGLVPGFLVHMLATAAGLSALFVTVPAAYFALKLAGTAYLLWMAWQSLRPGARSPFEVNELPHDPPRKLFLMGFFTSALNPKIAVFYLSLFPQFIATHDGHVFEQSIVLGLIQIFVSFTVNLLIILSAAKVASWFSRNPLWMAVQRYFMGVVLLGLAIKLSL